MTATPPAGLGFSGWSLWAAECRAGARAGYPGGTHRHRRTQGTTVQLVQNSRVALPPAIGSARNSVAKP
jgi:hypothetical protein